MHLSVLAYAQKQGKVALNVIQELSFHFDHRMFKITNSQAQLCNFKTLTLVIKDYYLVLVLQKQGV